jgi:proton glutamate symport protein
MPARYSGGVMKLKLHWQILIAMVLGFVIGFLYLVHYRGEPTGWHYQLITSMGIIFIRLLKMIIIPLVFSSIVSGVSGVADAKSLGRMGAKTFAYYILTSLCAILIGLTLTNSIKPGVNIQLEGNAAALNATDLHTADSLYDIILRVIPENPIAAAAEGEMLAIIFVAIFIGIIIARLDFKTGNFLRSFFNSFFSLMMKMTVVIIAIAPLGVVGLITTAVATTGFDLFISIGKYMLTIFFGLSIHLLVILPLIYFLFMRIPIGRHFRAMAPAMATAFSTSSSNATLPVTLRCMEENAGVSNRVCSFVLPLGATINMDGTALYECAGVIFIGQVLGFELTLSQQLVVVFTALLASIGAAGIPSAGLVTIFIVTQAIGLTDDKVMLIIGAMLAVDRPLDMLRTVVNVTSDSIGTAIIARSEGETGLYGMEEQSARKH